ncbi:MAG TPA: winged helix DNA-binding domain-containing protein [Solirubrobacter sp.]|nr:winged helix DNA-binding domain-containing protein [Solirubrobacter sp.]
MRAALSERQLNRALLARQGLLERRALAVPDALDAMGALQAQYAPSMYVGLWSRVAGLPRAAVTEALEARRAVQATLMRGTIHLVSRADYWPLAVATGPARRAAWPADYSAEAATLREALRDGPLRRKEIEALIGKEATRYVGLGLDLVRVPPSGTWERRRADVFGLAETWLGPADVGPDEALDRLVTRYLTGFGPATPAEIANWAGLKDVTPALERLPLRRFGGLVDLPGLPLPDADTPAPVRFLGTWDALLLVHARRAGVLPERHRPRVFSTKRPQSVGTFLVDGRVAGAWRPDGTLEPFEPLSAPVRREVEDEFARLLAFCA